MKQTHQWSLALLLAFLLLQIPFLTADPDKNLSFSRDAFTDEGLYSLQIRNFLLTGNFDWNQTDNAVKTPAFSFLLLITFFSAGISLLAARFMVLLLFLLFLWIALQREPSRKALLIFIPVTLLQFHVFQYSHFSLPEILCCGCILLALQNLAFSSEVKMRLRFLIAGLILLLVFFLKIQFAYVAVLWVAAFFLFRYQKATTITFIAISALLILTVLLLWFFPLQETVRYVTRNQTENRFPAFHQIPKVYLTHFYHYIIRTPYVIIAIAVLISLVQFFNLKQSMLPESKKFFILSLAWFLLEQHKLCMTYVPARYLASWAFSGGLLSSIAMAESIRQKTFRLTKLASLSTIIMVTACNLYGYVELYSNRTFYFRELNTYMSKCISGHNQVVMGSWAGSSTWNTRSISLPVWKDYFNHRNILQTYRPVAILSEPDEADSEQAFSTDGVNLKQDADSTRSFVIGRWTVNVFWMNE